MESALFFHGTLGRSPVSKRVDRDLCQPRVLGTGRRDRGRERPVSAGGAGDRAEGQGKELDC